MIISIDGPAASGKSTTAKLLSNKLGYIHLNSGLLYRAVTYVFIKKSLFGKFEKNLIDFFLKNKIDLKGDNLDKVFWNGIDITEKLSNENINKNINKISNNYVIREELVDKQRLLSLNRNIICEGRDIGTVVFPDAEFKFFLNASIISRVERRYEEFKKRNIMVEMEEIHSNLMNRDKNDINRNLSPLLKAEDAIEVDTTNLTIDQQVTKIYNLIKQGK